LESRAIKGAKTGGRAYGYSITDTGHVVNADEAAVVVEIFDWYAEGHGQDGLLLSSIVAE
jgi:hypothetical protein